MAHLQQEARRTGKGARPPDGAVDRAPLRDDARADRPLVCARWRHPITTDADRIEIDGIHEHSQINPHGFVWSFGCFGRAPGCAAAGLPSAEFTWFAGHTWQIEVCAACGFHLGWRFRSTERRFHGLIVGRVIAAEEDPGPR